MGALKSDTSTGMGILLFKTPTWLSLWYPLRIIGERKKKNTRFLCLAKLSSGLYQNQVFLSSNNFWPTQVSFSLTQQFVNNTGLYVSLELQFVANRRLYDIQLISYHGILSRRSTGSMHIVRRSHHHCKLNTISFECLILHLVIFCTWLILSLSPLIGVIAQCLMLPVRNYHRWVLSY